MKKIGAFLSRYRLINSLMALAFLLCALAVTPVNAGSGEDGGSAPVCSAGCVNWIQGVGCFDCLTCCSSAMGYRCTHDYNDSLCLAY